MSRTKLDCFGQFKSNKTACNRCWLGKSCKTVGEETERKKLNAVKSKGVPFRAYDGSVLSEMELGITTELPMFQENSTEMRSAVMRVVEACRRPPRPS